MTPTPGGRTLGDMETKRLTIGGITWNVPVDADADDADGPVRRALVAWEAAEARAVVAGMTAELTAARREVPRGRSRAAWWARRQRHRAAGSESTSGLGLSR